MSTGFSFSFPRPSAIVSKLAAILGVEMEER